MDSGEVFAANKDEIKEGEKKEITVNKTKILLAKVNGSFYAVDAICPHYKAPLVKGALCGTTLYCPWHHSAFDITNGNLCEPPAIDGIKTYDVIIKDNGVYIKLPAKKTAVRQKKSINPEKSFVILGSGAAGLMAAQTLRQQGFDGKLIMITKESELPYDRTALSKNYLSGKKTEDELLLRKEAFFEENNIELITGKEVKKADVANKKIVFANSDTLTYHSLLIATGSEAQKLTVAGANKKNVFTLRSEADAKQIVQQIKNSKKACLIGASFIVMETAASLTSIGLDVTVIAKEKLPFEKKFGKDIGKMFYNLHTQKGVVIKTEAEVEQMEGSDAVETIVLKSGERIETDIVIAGIGVKPMTDFIEGIRLHEEDKSVPVSEYLEAAEDVFSAGDVARYFDVHANETIRIEHWRVAQQHGRLAAMNMLNKKHSLKEVIPFFWTNQFDNRLSYVGHAEDWDEIVTDGNIEEQDFISYYIKNEKVIAAASMKRDIVSIQVEEIMLKNGLLTMDELKQKLNDKK